MAKIIGFSGFADFEQQANPQLPVWLLVLGIAGGIFAYTVKGKFRSNRARRKTRVCVVCKKRKSAKKMTLTRYRAGFDPGFGRLVKLNVCDDCVG